MPTTINQQNQDRFSQISDKQVILSEVYRNFANGHEPYDYQKRVATQLFSGRNGVITAPTGAGKTLSAIAPFLAAKKAGKPIADRLIYCLPLRSLAAGLYSEIKTKSGRLFRVSDNPDQPEELVVTLQIGSQQTDPFFRGDIIFTTIDQLLSSYINLPISLSLKLANINAGALIGALCVFDEVHLLDAGRALATTLELVERMRDYTKFLFMTATLSKKAVGRLVNYLGAQAPLEVEEHELSVMPAHRDKQRVWLMEKQPLNAEAVIDRHTGGRSIVICNTVDKAQAIYSELSKILTGSDIKPLLLHGRFFRNDRECIEGQLADYFGPEAEKSNIILVATQVVEAGLDISADVLHTELAPANCLVQRAGRCARYEAPRNIGAVYVYPLDKDTNDNPKLGPYIDAKELVFATEKCLPRTKTPLDIINEADLIDAVHGELEFDVISGSLKTLLQKSWKVEKAIDGADRARLRELIRDIDNVGVFIHSDPRSLHLSHGKWPELLSVSRTSLYKLRRFDTDDWKVMVPVESGDGGGDFGPPVISFRPVDLDESVIKSAWLLALSPAVACYDKDIGLVLGRSGPVPELKRASVSPVPPYSYKMESYQEHAEQAVQACNCSLKRVPVGIAVMSSKFGIEFDVIERLTLLGVAFHDFGKLTEAWQTPARQWQIDSHSRVKNYSPPLLAHTDYDPRKDKEKQKNRLYRRAPHSLEGAFALNNIVYDIFNIYGLAQYMPCLVTAIARHHHAGAKTLSDFTYVPEAMDICCAQLKGFGFSADVELLTNPETACKKRFADQVLVGAAKQPDLLPLYWWFARNIRLADQAAMRR